MLTLAPLGHQVVSKYAKLFDPEEEDIGGYTSFSDPLESTLENMNELMFYLGALLPSRVNDLGFSDVREFWNENLDSTQTINTSTTGYLTDPQEIFHTDLIWFIAAAIVEIVCVALIVPTYMGFWKLGRRVSFSPLEIAKAFEAPMLESCHSNSSGGQIARNLKGREIRYGAVGENSTKIAFGPLSNVKTLTQSIKLDA